MYEQAIVQLRKLATSDNPEWVTRYRAICKRRDVILADAVTSVAEALLDSSDFQPNLAYTSLENYPQALDQLEHHLTQSSIPLTEQQLLALLGVGALAGWAVQFEDEEHDLRVYQTGSVDLDMFVVHRLARALDRSPDTEPVLWERIRVAASSEGDDTIMVLGACRSLIDEVPMNELDNSTTAVIVDSIMGG
jgi:hypothetical protein